MNDIKKMAIECLLVSLRAREKRASGYVLNTSMQIEAELLREQIQALDMELDNHD